MTSCPLHYYPYHSRKAQSLTSGTCQLHYGTSILSMTTVPRVFRAPVRNDLLFRLFFRWSPQRALCVAERLVSRFQALFRGHT